MKYLVVFFLAAVYAEPPVLLYNTGYSTVYRQSAEQLVQPSYPVAGFRPVGAQFNAAGSTTPQQVPQLVFVPPQTKSSPPQAEATTVKYNTVTEQPFATDNSTEPESEQINVERNKDRLTEGTDDSFTQQGVYYIYHPTGLLQKIAYSTTSDVENMGYTAQLKYQDVEPIKDPIYTYDPNTFVVKQLQV